MLNSKFDDSMRKSNGNVIDSSHYLFENAVEAITYEKGPGNMYNMSKRLLPLRSFTISNSSK